MVGVFGFSGRDAALEQVAPEKQASLKRSYRNNDALILGSALVLLGIVTSGALVAAGTIHAPFLRHMSAGAKLGAECGAAAAAGAAVGLMVKGAVDNLTLTNDPTGKKAAAAKRAAQEQKARETAHAAQEKDEQGELKRVAAMHKRLTRAGGEAAKRWPAI